MDVKINSDNQFYLNIRFQENQSWQGSLQRLDTGETINFRSELELLHLIQAATRKQQHFDHENQKLREWKDPEEGARPTIDNRMKNGTTGA